MFRVFLICFTCCCSSLIPLKQSENILSEDHTQVVERKCKNNYYSERQYDVLYSLNEFASDIYWINMMQMLNNDNLIFLGGTQEVSCYNVRNGISSWVASSSTLSSMRVMFVENSTINQFSTNDVYFTASTFNRVQQSGNFYRYLLRFNLYVYGNNITIDYNSYFDSQLNFYGCKINMGYSSYIAEDCIISLPKSNCGIAQIAGTTIDYDEGYRQGYQTGFNEGYASVQAEANQEEYMRGYTAGQQDGYAEGIAYSQEQSSTALTIFTGILEVGLLPVNVFLQMFNYEVFGINIAGFISGLITIAMVMIFVRFIFGGKDNGK